MQYICPEEYLSKTVLPKDPTFIIWYPGTMSVSQVHITPYQASASPTSALHSTHTNHFWTLLSSFSLDEKLRAPLFFMTVSQTVK